MKTWDLRHYDAFFLDVDGVLVRGSHPIDGAVDALRELTSVGQVFILTNNSTRSRKQHAEQLCSLGFSVSSNEVIASSYVVAEYLRDTYGPTVVWPIGEGGLSDELRLSGHRIASEPEQADCVVAGMDRSIDYRKLADGLRALNAGARFVATNQDGTFPTPDGLKPGAGAIVGALCGMGFAPEITVGKPASASYDIARAMTEVDVNKILMVGDRLETDILGGNQCGLDTLLVLTGISSESEIAESRIHPTWVADSLMALISGEVVSGNPSMV